MNVVLEYLLALTYCIYFRLNYIREKISSFRSITCLQRIGLCLRQKYPRKNCDRLCYTNSSLKQKSIGRFMRHTCIQNVEHKIQITKLDCAKVSDNRRYLRFCWLVYKNKNTIESRISLFTRATNSARKIYYLNSVD